MIAVILVCWAAGTALMWSGIVGHAFAEFATGSMFWLMAVCLIVIATENARRARASTVGSEER